MSTIEESFSPGLAARVECLISNFELYAGLYDENSGYEKHNETIGLRAQMADPVMAVSDGAFLRALSATLRKWRAFRPGPAAPWQELREAFTPTTSYLLGIKSYAIDDADLPFDQVVSDLWAVIDHVTAALGKSSSPLVLGSKALHHVVPDLIPPMDRINTGWFLAWGPSAWTKSGAQSSFVQSMRVFRAIAMGASPRRFVTGDGWRTSVSKLIDNAIWGFK
jgi:hypothetical protein